MKRSLILAMLSPLAVLTIYTAPASARVACTSPGFPVGCIAVRVDRGAPGVGVLPGPGVGAPGVGVAPRVVTPGLAHLASAYCPELALVPLDPVLLLESVRQDVAKA